MPGNDDLTPFFLHEENVGLELRLSSENILGRDSGLKTDSMSRRHVQIVTKQNRWFLADLNSTNGTYLNGKKMKAREWYSLRLGDEIEFGGLTFRLKGPAPGPEAEVEKPRAETVSTTLPRDGAITSRVKIERAAPASAKESPPLAPGTVGFAPRLAAGLIDTIAVVLISFIVTAPLRLPAFYFAAFLPLAYVAVVLIPLRSGGQSLGKMMLGLKVAAPDGSAPGLKAILGRELIGKPLAIALAPAILFRRQNWNFWDTRFGTRVIHILEENDNDAHP